MQKSLNPLEKKKIATQIYPKLPFQKTKDSPTIKYYTDWNRYVPFLKDEFTENYSLTKEWVDYTRKTDITIHLKPSSIEITGSSPGIKIIISPIEELENNSEARVLNLIDPHEGKLLAMHISKLDKIVYLEAQPYTSSNIKIIVYAPIKGHKPYHLTLNLKENSKIALETIVSQSQPSGLATITLEGILENNSYLNAINIVDPWPTTPIYLVRRIEQKEQAKAKLHTIITGGLMSHVRDESLQDGYLASVQARGTILARPRERVDYITNTVNNAPETSAEVIVKGFNLGGDLFHRGTIKATQDGTDSINKLESILTPLTEKGSTASVPMLEVDTDLISEGAHSTDISSFGEDEIFYMESRGLTKEEAISLIVQSTILNTLQYDKDIDYNSIEIVSLELTKEFFIK